MGNDLKCNPAVKTRADQLALRHAVVEDRIDVIATDHAPHTREEKALPFIDAPAGLPLVQHALVSLVEHVKAGEFTIEQVVQKTAHAPATLFEISERGYIREGYWADLTVVDPNRTPWSTKNRYTPSAAGRRFGDSPSAPGSRTRS